MTWWERLRSPATGVAKTPGTEVRFGRTLEGLIGRLKKADRPQLLDLGRAQGANINYFIEVGCKVHVDDYIAGLLERQPPPPTRRPARRRRAVKPAVPVGRKSAAKSGNGDGPGEEETPAPSAPPVAHDTGQFNAVLCWDLFDYLSAEEAQQVGREIHRVTADDGHILAFFGPKANGEARGPFRFRILGDGEMHVLEEAGPKLRPHHMTNRDIQKVFSGFEVSQTVLLKNGVREILLRKRRQAEGGKKGALTRRLV